MTILKWVFIALGVYFIYLTFFYKPRYKLIEDAIVSGPLNAGAKTSSIDPIVNDPSIGGLTIYTFKQGEEITGIRNEGNGTLLVTLERFGLPNIQREIPLDKVEVINKWI